ncbi:MAG TPA: VOC family protein [Gemmatimonadales bacterium]|jgi:hypothetical protein
MSTTLTAVLPGRFVWHELMTSDPGAAKAFYTAVVGWGTQPWAQDGSYTVWTNGEAPVGGLMALPDEVKAMGVPPNWLTYISVPDTDAYAKRVEELGGKTLKPPTSLPNVGRFAVVADPQGAAFALYTSETPSLPDAAPTTGEFSWHELATTDYEAAFKFYSTLFGWVNTETMDMGPGGKYLMYGFTKELPLGGIYNKDAKVPVPNWLPYALVPDADAAAATAEKLGGKVIVPPMEVPGGDRIAVVLDPQGAAFAVHSKKK